MTRTRSRSGLGRRGWCWALLLAAALGGPSAADEPPPRCPSAHADRCKPVSDAFGEFIVDGKLLQLRLPDSDNGLCFTLSYPGVVTLEESVLPRFDVMRKDTCAVIKSVEDPNVVAAKETTYAAILRALNVAISEKLTLIHGLLRSEHLAGLTALPELELKYMNSTSTAPDLHHLIGLRRLTLEETKFTTADLELLPAGLERLHLTRTGIDVVPAAALERLSDLTALLVTEDNGNVSVEAAGGLRTLTILKSDNNAYVGLSLPSGLEDLTITGWAPPSPKPWEACAKLGALELVYAEAHMLPAGWVENCTELHTLTVTRATSLESLDNATLRGAKHLKRLSLTECKLKVLPVDLLEYAPELTELDLSDNHLLTLPSMLFYRSRRLRDLVLSWNKLNNSALAALKAPALRSLNVLRLDGNAALAACPPSEREQWSYFKNMKNLSKLDLSSTNTSQVCEDWRRLPKLTELVLKSTAIARLQCADLRFNTESNVTVDLTGTNVTALVFDREDWETLKDEGGVGVHVVLSAPLVCDCGLYWAAAALNRTARLRVEGARCPDGRALRDVLLGELVCAVEAGCSAHWPVGCACFERPEIASPGRVLRVACAGADLTRVPRADYAPAAPPGTGYALDLQLANNGIDSLDPEDLPVNLVKLDLRNNSLTTIDAGAVKALVSRPDRRVWLAGNPLDCGCRAAAALAAVHSSPDVFDDRKVAACAGGESLAAAAFHPPPPCGVGETSGDSQLIVIAVAALVVVVILAAALALALLRPELRLRAKAALRARGLMPRAREADDGRVYDAFVSFAHADEAVVREMADRLESGATPLRLCLHYRDWAPGGWIPTQIAASVRVSRRTVAVVSAAFLRSRWARAEFREAYAAALRDAEPRLVVVLLEDPARLPLDAELRAYLAANTYVRWGDPWFWRKLRRALPAPRRPTRVLPWTDEAPARSTTTVSTDTSFTATVSTDASVRSAATASTDTPSTATVSTDASVRSAATASTDTSVRSATTISVS